MLFSPFRLVENPSENQEMRQLVIIENRTSAYFGAQGVIVGQQLPMIDGLSLAETNRGQAMRSAWTKPEHFAVIASNW